MQSSELSQNYFELFGLKPVFDLDPVSLHAQQQRLQAIYHPDRHVGSSELHRRLSVQMASRINQAYETLRDPVKRSRYLLEIHGASLPDDSATTSDSEFLMQQIELREAIEDCRRADDGLQRSAAIENDLDHRAQDLAREFAGHIDAMRLDAAIDSSRKMQFIQRIQQQLEEIQFELEET